MPRRSPRSAARPLAPRRPALAAALLAVAALAPLPAASAQQAFVYGLTDDGTLTANATVLEKLPGKVTADPATFGRIWWKVLVDGSDRWVLRLDGRVQKNGELLHELDYTTVFDGSWVDLDLIDDELWAMRNDGALARDGLVVVNLPAGDFFFQESVVRGPDIYTLRSDGAVYRNLELTPAFQFEGGPGPITGADDGEDGDTIWRALAVDPVDGTLHALRNDGKIAVGDPDGEGDPPSGTLVADLPFDDMLNTESQAAVLAAIYHELEFLDDGTWRALNGEGEIYEEGSHVTPVVDLPGGPFNGGSQLYIDMLGGATFLTLRADGRLYVGTDEDPIVNLPKDDYRSLASSASPPDLTNFKNSRPVVTKTKAVLLEGDTGVSIPVLAADIEKTEDDLVFTVDPETVPAGATWNPTTRTLDWPDPGPAGKYSLKVTVDDGETMPVVSKNRIVVKPLHDKPKNSKPQVGKVKKARALVGVPFVLPLVVTDLDGDMVTISVDETKPPFTLGATFDPMTNTFTWTPTLEHLGKHKVKFVATDGIKARKAAVKLDVVSSLLGF